MVALTNKHDEDMQKLHGGPSPSSGHALETLEHQGRLKIGGVLEKTH